jgi:methionyl-tRNA synthetase
MFHFAPFSRSLSFLVKFFESMIPPMKMTEVDFRVVAEINKEVSEYVSLLEVCKLRDGLRRILAVSKIGNVYFQSQQPWTLNKDDAE